ncbi:MAG TPA: alpha/beta fold hydrolase [Candidatus Binataceae bacterium]|nr:alpha/beta fold hydrolase [Candidatus Binataceae bacterium]
MEKQLDVRGVTLSVTDQGDGAPILFVHGLGGFKENWEENLGHFAQNYRAIAIDLPGFGDSEKRTDLPYEIEFFSDMLCAALDRLNVDRAHWIGNSMGGHIAAFTALKNPARVDRLVLVDAAGTNQDEITALFSSNQSLIPDPASLPTRELVEMMMRNFVFFGPSPQIDKMIDRALADQQRPDAQMRQQAILKALQSILTTPIADRLGGILSPTLVLWGKEDRLVSVAHGETFAARIANARLHVIDQCGHCPMLEKPEEFNRVVGEFLAPD